MTVLVNTQQEMLSVIETIQKMFRLGNDDGATPEEREAALDRAYALMAKHNLDEATVNQDFEAVTEELTAFKREPWLRGIASAVATLYYTATYYQWRNGAYRIVFVGTKANIAASQSIMSWLVESVRKESNKKYVDPSNRRSFRLGAARKLQERANQIVREEKQRAAEAEKAEREAQENAVTCVSDNFESKSAEPTAASTSTALVHVRQTLETKNEDYKEKLGLRLMRSGRGSSYNPDAYNSGKAYGNTVSLNRQIGGGNHKRLGG